METPFFSHITREDYEYVYEPSEDTFLLLDAIEADLDFIQSRKPLICVEIGSGSGVIITAVAKKLSKNLFCISTDINSRACTVTKNTALHNFAKLDVIQMNLTDCLRYNCIDLLIFNPPYVPTDSDDYKSFSNKDIVHSWSGGLDGCKTVNEIIYNLQNILSNKGIFYLLLLKENKPIEIIDKLVNKNKFKAEIFMERKIPGEHLYVLKITR